LPEHFQELPRFVEHLDPVVLLVDNEEILRAFNLATVGVEQTRQITPAAEWLLDNFYLIDEQIKWREAICRATTPGTARLLSGQSAPLPRVYDIVLELIAHVDAGVDATPSPPSSPRTRRSIAEAGRVVGDSDHAAARFD
jgi:hypothetical protein